MDTGEAGALGGFSLHFFYVLVVRKHGHVLRVSGKVGVWEREGKTQTT